MREDGGGRVGEREGGRGDGGGTDGQRVGVWEKGREGRIRGREKGLRYV